MINCVLEKKNKEHSHGFFAMLCIAFLGLYVMRDNLGVAISYYLIYAAGWTIVLVVSLEEALCFFLALSVFTNAGLNGVFCSGLFLCVLIRYIGYVKKIKLYSAVLICFCAIELLFYFAGGRISSGSYLAYAMVLLALVVVQQYPLEKVDIAFVVKTFILFSLVYVLIVVTSVVLEVGSLKAMMDIGLRTDEYQRLSKIKAIAPNQNYISQLCSINLALCVLMISKKHSFWMYMSASVLFLLFGLLTVSKSFMVVLVILSAYLIFLTFKKNWLRGTGVAILLMVCALMIYRFFGDTLIDLVLERFRTEDLTTGRSSINHDLLNYMNEHPWAYVIGNGILQVHYVTAHAIHSSFFEILGGWGAPGLALVVAYFALSIKEAKDNMKKKKMFIDGFSYLPVLTLIGYTINGMLFSQQFTIVQLTVCVLAIQIKEKKQNAV